MTWIDQYLGEYYQWLKDRTFTQQSNTSDWVLINTPFLGLYNDAIEIYAKKKEGNILLSDDGKTLSDLDLMGVSLNRSQHRRNIVEKIIRTHGVKWNAGTNELSVDADIKNFPQRKHDFVSAIIELNDLNILSTGAVASMFKDDVTAYLDEREIIYTADFIAKGSTGLEFMFDFQIAGKKKEIVIKAFNSVTRTNIFSFLFSWGDIRENREATTHKSLTSIAFINDTREKSIKPELIEAMQTKGTNIIPWSGRDKKEYAQLLVA